MNKARTAYAVIEQTKDHRKRVAFDPVTRTFFETAYGCIFLERGFTYPYGWLKGTGEPPGPHLDVFVMTGADCAPGDEIPVRVVGVFLRNDQDHKLVAVPADRAETDLSELPEAERTALSRVYPRVDAGEGWFGAECAEKVIAEFCANRGQTV